MSEPKWTAGPWHLLRRGRRHRARISGASWSGFARVVVRMEGSADDNAEGMANARLISAAPDLYAQLEDARITLGEVAKAIAYDYPSFANNVINQCAIRCGDVLAKARGETA